MAIDVTLRDIQSGYLTATAFTENNTLIEQALAKAIDRNGGANNEMLADLDMGLNFINNLPDALLIHQAVPLGQVTKLIQAGTSDITSTTDLESFTATAGQDVFTFSVIEYLTGVNALLVFVDGVYQLVGTDYNETSTTSITFTTPLDGGETVVVLGARFDAEVFADASASSATEAEASATDAEAAQAAAEAAQAAAESAAGYKLGINTQAGTSYTLVASDEGDLVRMTNSGANTVTVPTNASVPFEIGTIVNIRQSGTGTTTVNPDAGVTINAPLDEFTTDGEEFGVAIVKVGTDEWDLVKSYAGVRNDQFDSSIIASDGSSGYQKLPSGLIMQWGQTTVAPLSSVDVTFPIAFPNSVINVQVSSISNESDITFIHESLNFIKAVTNTTLTVINPPIGDGDGDRFDMTCYWFAVGV